MAEDTSRGTEIPGATDEPRVVTRSTLVAAARRMSDAWNEYVENDAPMDDVVDAIGVLRAALAAEEEAK